MMKGSLGIKVAVLDILDSLRYFCQKSLHISADMVLELFMQKLKYFKMSVTVGLTSAGTRKSQGKT